MWAHVELRHLTSRDPRYPALLAAVPSPPALWVRGDLERDDALAIALVGTRRASAYGLAAAERLAFDLAARGVTVVSGLARGIDTAAHRGALAAGGRTIAVLGAGVDVVYPPESAALGREIERRGALVSQFPPGMPPQPWNFPLRNRTLAGLALGVVVVEAPERSGALITAGLAAELGREVFAVPGQITVETSRGSNRLIQDGAKLVRDWCDIVQELSDSWRRAVRSPSEPAGRADEPAPDSEEGRILTLLTSEQPQHIEDLIARGHSSPARVAAALLALELGGQARQLDGQRWVKAATRGRSS
jgi:DNA processing protein